ncbi:MAG: C45 family autoproteolytic acyltransferase/hydrolase [Pirellula sp.]|jgi:dienelactone hydrolase|nr:C45 family autoproteolytic acyltransferase/hydrolase [Pirellula sp.]
MNFIGIRIGWIFVLPLLVLSVANANARAVDPDVLLADQIKPWLNCLTLKQPSFSMRGEMNVNISGKPQAIEVAFSRQDDERFFLHLKHPEYEFGIVRNRLSTALVLPKHNRVWLGTGPVDEIDHIAPNDSLNRLVSDGSIVYGVKPLLKQADAPVDFAGALLFLSGLKYQSEESDSSKGAWALPDGSRFQFNGPKVDFSSKDGSGWLSIGDLNSELTIPDAIDQAWVDSRFGALQINSIDRNELERTLARGLRRAFEVLAPSPKLTNPRIKEQSVENGKLLAIDGQRVAVLWGSPEQIGTAHGKLLKDETVRCIDSVIYGFGAVQTIATGKWFRSELESAYQRLSPHIPERHKRETRALAASLGIDGKLLEVVNVFPELFHCSGFAVFGSATEGGKLYHGRVLDYMTTIGLQDAATTFIVAPDDYLPFANVGYGGFIGSVSGMNGAKISLGEMGGRGEGQWDGVPMATLMRRALEECSTLDEVKSLWADNPRTCEYYYVFADGKNRSAVGVAATPEKIEFVNPGQAHPLLGDGIPDAVVLSAGNRLEELRNRVKNSYGKINTAIGQQLMCRPVAMSSNLHNVLFVPEDLVLHVANADHKNPAADRPYTKLDLAALLKQVPEVAYKSKSLAVQTKAPADQAVVPAKMVALDSIPSVVDDPNERARKSLDELLWKPQPFDVSLETIEDDTFVRFPSAVETGNEKNDRVALQWYKGTGSKTKGASSLPAVIVVHESGRGMTVGKMIAKGIANQGIHAFMIHLPHYGVRRSPQTDSEDVARALKQSIADVRRAFDAVAILPEVDRTKISLQGTSLGGFVAATTAGIDDRFHSVVVLLAGGDLYSVVTQGKKDAQKFRDQMAAQGLDDEGIRMCLDCVEPLHLAHRVNANRTWLYSGKFDDVVPPRNSKLFAKAANLPESHHIEMEADHYSGIIQLPSVLKHIAQLASDASQ